VITCAIRPDKLEMAKRELEAVIKLVMAKEPACHGIRVHDDPKNANRLMIIENWESEEVFGDPHMQTPHMQAFLKKAEAFLDGPAEFGFWREIVICGPPQVTEASRDAARSAGGQDQALEIEEAS
jgi:quinol monooxygenase YgiN